MAVEDSYGMNKDRNQDSAVNLIYESIEVWEQRVSWNEYFVAGLYFIPEEKDL